MRGLYGKSHRDTTVLLSFRSSVEDGYSWLESCDFSFISRILWESPGTESLEFVSDFHATCAFP